MNVESSVPISLGIYGLAYLPNRPYHVNPHECSDINRKLCLKWNDLLFIFKSVFYLR